MDDTLVKVALLDASMNRDETDHEFDGRADRPPSLSKDREDSMRGSGSTGTSRLLPRRYGVSGAVLAVLAVPAVLATILVVLGPFRFVVARTAHHAGAAPRETAWLQVSEVGSSGFTISVALPAGGDHGLRPSAADGRCRPPRLPAATGDAAAPGGRHDYGWLIGLPDAGMPAIEVLEVRTERLAIPRCASDSRASPVPRVVRAAPTEQAPAVAPEDSPVVSIERAGRLRHQELGRLVVRPLARAGPEELVVRTLIRARIRYAEGPAIGRATPLDGPFAAMTGRLLNHDFLPCRRPCARASTGNDGAAFMMRAGALEDSGPDVTPMPGIRPSLPDTSSGETERTRGKEHDDIAAEPGTAAADPHALKLVVDRDGPVAVTGARLREAGWDLAAVDPARLSLTSGGRPHAFTFEDAGDGRFDDADRVVFQGQAMTGPYTRNNVYWLRHTGTPIPFGRRDAVPGDVGAARSFTRTLRFEADTRILWSLTPDQGDDRWMWGNELTGPARITHTLSVDNLAPDAQPAILRVTLQGYTDDRLVDPDHHLRLWWNGRPVLDSQVDGLGVHRLEARLLPADLVEGDNELVVESVGDTGAVVDAVFLNWVEVEHAAGYRATADRLDFRAPAAGTFDLTLDGFSGPEVTVLDVTDPAAPVSLVGAVIEPASDDTYAVRVATTATEASRYVAFTPGAAREPARVLQDAPSDLLSSANGADYIVITHPDFAAAIAPLTEHRAAQGMRVHTVLIDDVYDEFSHGIFDPRAIRSFLRHAFDRWQAPAPTYALLVGESNLDYRGGLKAGPANYVPSVQVDAAVDPVLSMYTSDLWYAALHEGDVLPDVLIGRISAARAADVRTIVDKTLRYEALPIEDAWRQRAILVADDDGAPEFEAASEQLAGVMPPDSRIQRFYAADYPRDRDLAGDLRAAIDEGVFAVNFNGHGNVALWSPWPGGGPIFANEDIAALRNGDRPAILTSGTCMTGWIDHPLKPVSMTEQWLLNPDGGGVLAWSASGFAPISSEQALLLPFYRGLHGDRGATAGSLVAIASLEALAQSASYADVIRQYVMLGDPALVVAPAPPLPTPTPPPPVHATWLPFAMNGSHVRP